MRSGSRWWAGALHCALLSMLLLSGPSQAGELWRQALPQAQPLGSGQMTWLGLRIYQATLWATQPAPDFTQPFALQLTYRMSISRERLANTSMDEIRRLSGSPIAPETLLRWQAALEKTLVDVARDDQLIGVYLPGRGLQFYDADKLLGEIDDPALARAFFDIWLSPGTRDPALRKRLLGQ
ncbi:chalcone isomerase family protein [Herbaspirillum sp. alder98]|uniref:chalcone isomerase family protein n=1 Tax=Herbaspirillum sp. alder98 TaxID=2913096 RepID=UPI001CD8A6E6|nr:chalcone isomerase family protein [Herbaspirillum sp. alder98]MCA1324150.1 chalcone isomerase family protein [Herbaspirillum sp. alder98]